MTQNEITVQYQYSESEYLAASRLLFLSINNPLPRLIASTAILIAGAILCFVLSLEPVVWVSMLVLVFLQGGLVYNAVVVIPRKYFRGDGKFHDRYELTFSDEGIRARTAKIDSKHAWSLYTKAIEGRDIYLLLYGQDTRMMTAVPKRVFADKDQEYRFRELVTRHIVDSRFKPIPASEIEYKPTSLTPPDWH